MTGFDVKRKRPWWFGWIPAAILLVLIAAVGVTAAVFVTSGAGDPAPEATEGQVTDLNWSIFTPEGRAYIDRTREVRIDFSKPPIEAAELGLDDDGSLTIGPYDTDELALDVYLVANGGGEAPGGKKFALSEITIVTSDGVVTEVRAAIRGAQGFRPTLDALLQDAPLYGWDVSGVDAIYQQVEDATRAGEGYEFTFGPGNRLGMDVAATATCDTSSSCAVEYDVAPSVR